MKFPRLPLPRSSKSAGFFLWLPLGMLAFLPILATWNENRYQVTASSLTLPLLLGLLTASLTWCVFFPGFKRNRFAYLAGSAFVVYMLSNDFSSRLSFFTPLLKIFLFPDSSNPWAGVIEEGVFVLLIFWIGLLLAQWLSRLLTRKQWSGEEAARAAILALTVTFVLVAAPTVHSLALEWAQFYYRPTALPANTSSGIPTSRPDIYYIVLDRYTSQSVLKEQFGYDNTEFLKFLTDNGYSVNPQAHSNYPYTTMSIASTLEAGYHTDLVKRFADAPQQTQEPFHDTIRYSPVIQKLKSLGYSYYHLGSWYEASNQAPLADYLYQPEGRLTILGHTFVLDTFPKQQLQKSPYWPLIQQGITVGHFSVLTYGGIGEAEATLYKLDTLRQLAQAPAGGRFIFAHILVPHDPYYFNADGSRSTSSGNDNNGEPIKQKYLGQVQFINTQMKDILAKVQAESKGEAVVILQADEGPYPLVLNDEQFNGDIVGDELSNQSMLDWSDTDLQMKYGILAAYHLPNASATALAAGGDSVNIFRVVFNTYFGGSLTYLPRCYYAYPEGRSHPFDFTDITGRLTGQDNPACSKDGS